jgi:vitamin B12/bleomycin/antimicrobial peptide transport system ATP-binding/permease protein
MLTKTSGISALAAEVQSRSLLRCFLQSAAGFWGKRGAHASWVLSGILLLIVLVSLVASYGMNLWHRVIFDALQVRDAHTVLELSVLYLLLLAGSVFLTVMQLWARMTMQRRWREWLNGLLIDRWLNNGRYYQLNLAGGGYKNPECRIADDVRIATEAPVEFATSALTAVLSATMFIVVLWTVGGAFTVHIG